MTNEEIAVKLQLLDDRSSRNEGRIKKLEKESEALHELASSVAVLASEMKAMNANVSTLNDKVDELEEKPGKRWESIATHALCTAAAALITYLLTRVGL